MPEVNIPVTLKFFPFDGEHVGQLGFLFIYERRGNRAKLSPPMSTSSLSASSLPNTIPSSFKIIERSFFYIFAQAVHADLVAGRMPFYDNARNAFIFPDKRLAVQKIRDGQNMFSIHDSYP